MRSPLGFGAVAQGEGGAGVGGAEFLAEFVERTCHGPPRAASGAERATCPLSSLPADLRAAMSNVEIVVEDEPPDGQPLLGLYRCREGAARTAECFPTRSASSAGRSRDSLPAMLIVCAARSGTSCSTRSRITSGSATSG